MRYLIIAIIFAIPQWIIAVSTNYFDEVVTSSIHITGPNQFAEGVFPPRHNALPDVIIKETGQQFYSADQQRARDRWLLAQVDRRLKPVEEFTTSTQANWQTQQEANSMLQEAWSSWAHFPQFATTAERAPRCRSVSSSALCGVFPMF